MNSIHDMGGMTCFGAIEREENEPTFHGEWERRVLALTLATAVFFGPLDRRRHVLEQMSPLEYLSCSYYERWLVRIERLSKETGFVTDKELTSGAAVIFEDVSGAPVDSNTMDSIIRQGSPSGRDSGRSEPCFAVEDRVRARNINPPGHTRLARYVRGRVGVVHQVHGIHRFPDTTAHDKGENPQPLYSVRFDATELWGSLAPIKDSLFIDLWEDYLESENG